MSTEGDSRANAVIKMIKARYGEDCDLKYVFNSFRNAFGLMHNSDARYFRTIGAAAFSKEVNFGLRGAVNGRKIKALQKIVRLFKKPYGDEVFMQVKDRGYSYSQLVSVCEPYLKVMKDEDEDGGNQIRGIVSKDYDILKDVSYEQAHEIGEYSSDKGAGKLCYTQSEETWDKYTAKGTNRVYCCLRHGWKDMEPEVGVNVPYDEYGLSMIFLFIDTDGEIAYSNTRWNHVNMGDANVDHPFTKSDISDFVGVDFDGVFKPYTKDELHARGAVLFEDVPILLEQGVKPEDIFDNVDDFRKGFAIVELCGMNNYIFHSGGEYRLLCPEQWFDEAYNFYGRFAIVYLNGKYTYMKSDGEYIKDDLWFDNAWDFSEGYAAVEVKDKGITFIDTDGEYMKDGLWLRSAWYFSEGYAGVKVDKGCTFIDTKGDYIKEDLWFDWVENFKDGFARVNKEGKASFYIDINGDFYDENHNPINELC